MGGGNHGFLSSGLGRALLFSNPITAPAGLVNEGIIQPMNKMNDRAKADMAQQATDSATASATLQKNLAEQPKTTAADNFLAMKSKALSALRLGFAGTATGASGQPGSILPTGLKSKLGS